MLLKRSETSTSRNAPTSTQFIPSDLNCMHFDRDKCMVSDGTERKGDNLGACIRDQREQKSNIRFVKIPLSKY